MSNVASALKSEISRVCRKEIRQATAPLKASTTKYRSQIAALRKDLAQQQAVIKQLQKALGKKSRQAPQESESADERSLRFSAARFASMRAKLGITAREMAQLLGVSQLSVYKWESGKARPRRAQLEAIASIRPLGKREVQRRLSESEEG
jgi:DNA-binding transcriptional regulator YiaG